MKKGKISPVSRPSAAELEKWFSDGCCSFWEQPNKITIGNGIPPVDRIGFPYQYGRIFGPKYELRWEGSRFWLAEEVSDGQFEIDEEEKVIFLRADNDGKFKLIKVLHYRRNGFVLYTRFKEVVI
ncbi:MAG: hypothetical protein ABSG91_14950 [Syntrophobacteraceae bacterium]